MALSVSIYSSYKKSFKPLFYTKSNIFAKWQKNLKLEHILEHMLEHMLKHMLEHMLEYMLDSM